MFHGTRRFIIIAMLSRACHWSLPWACPYPTYPICLRFILILSSCQQLGLPNGIFWFSHPTWFDDSNYTWLGVKVMKLVIMQFSPVVYLLLGPYILLSTLFSNTISHCFTHKSTGKIVVLYISVLIFFRQQTRRQDSQVNVSKHCPNLKLLLISSWIKFWFFFTVFPHVWILPHFNRYVSYLYVMMLSWSLVTRH
jgi:hypothetical protein